jgi:hypothetical protein
MRRQLMPFNERDLSDYVDVAARIAEFRAKHPNGRLRGDFRMLQVGDQHLVAYRAEAWRDEADLAPGVGCAWELVPGRTPFTRGSELQNAETSAWGRAIIACGAADAKKGIASRDEVAPRWAEGRSDGLPVNRDGSLSRSRTTDAEKDAAGVMTSQQHAEHTQLAKLDRGRPAERLPTTPAGDPWYAGGLPPEDQPGAADGKQKLALVKLAAAANLATPDQRHARWGELLGLDVPVETSALSMLQAALIIKELQK